jgi:hypothetical protein
MSLTLHLGVVDLNYGHEPPEPGKKKKKPTPANISTGDVAEILEAKYHVMEVYWQLHGQENADALVESIVGATESLMMGAPPSADPFGGATSKIEDGFKRFLSEKEMDSLGYPGVPTKASLEGVDHRKKNRKGTPGRPSFIDTTQYVDAFKAWVDG